ncbi:penicillin-binding protein 1A [Roseibium sp. RKSG952]|uniref:penicillin-binding protein 1A n=1 Tax=Roseibium sp. RKSG952 TaxID=2529384 RepID=UPI0012BD36CE|nr:PBP1A family penicillin-binding protein [Roseibium sp. RKSG952]MTH95153.1 PBP1A family penicillin-binding protein [Roseibium sp. RKSG952]
MRLLRTAFAAFLVLGSLIAFGVFSFALAYLRDVAPTLPDHMFLSEWKPEQGSVIRFSDGTVMGVHALQDREFVPLSNIPDIVVNAFLSAEDSRYWKHEGVDGAAVLRAALSNVSSGGSGRAEGGSTITQQVVKNLIVGSEKTLDRKIREAILAMRIDRDLGKDRILEIYLNEIYLGAGAYGVKSAARRYFDAELEDLSQGQAAVLAGLPKAPSAYNPYQNPVRATERRNYVLKRMLDDGYIDTATYRFEAMLPIKLAESAADGQRGHLWSQYAEEHVRRLLLESYGSDGLYSGGLDVTTTIDANVQRAVHEELRAGILAEDKRSGWRGALASGISFPVDWSLSALDKPLGSEDWFVAVVSEVSGDVVVETPLGRFPLSSSSVDWAARGGVPSDVFRVGDAVLVDGDDLVQIPEVQGAAVVMDPASGAVLALGGGFSFEASEFDRATQARRQPGSVFKSFVYLAALERGYDATSPLMDAPIALQSANDNEDWRPKGGEGWGLITFRRSLEASRNMSTVRLLYGMGLDSVEDIVARLGIPMRGDPSYALALGAGETTPLEIATAYAAIANGGYRVDPIFRGRPKGGLVQVIDGVSAAQLSSILSGVPVAGTARKAFYGYDRVVAGKTGTTNSARDAWFVGYDPGIVVVVWIGRDDNQPLLKGAGGGSTAAPVARRIMERVEALVPRRDFYLPDGAHEIVVDSETGMPDENGNVIEIIRSSESHLE